MKLYSGFSKVNFVMLGVFLNVGFDTGASANIAQPLYVICEGLGTTSQSMIDQREKGGSC